MVKALLSESNAGEIVSEAGSETDTSFRSAASSWAGSAAAVNRMLPVDAELAEAGSWRSSGYRSPVAENRQGLSARPSPSTSTFQFS